MTNGATPGKVVVIGSMNIDLTVRTERFPEPGETLNGSELATAAGGKSANQAAAASILGSEVILIGAVGKDGHGELALAAATAAGVDISSVTRLVDHATGTAMIVVNAVGENTIIISAGANGALTPELATTNLPADAAVLCLCLEVPLPTVAAAAQAGHDAGLQVVLNLSPYQDVPAELLTATDLLLVNESETAQLVGDQVGDDWPATLDALASKGIRRAIVTLGGDGAVVLDDKSDRDPVTMIEPTRVNAVDTTGCGDAFTGAVAHQIASGANLVQAARFAARVGALAATRAGAQSSYGAFAELANRALSPSQARTQLPQ